MKTRFTLSILFPFSLSFILLVSSGNLQAQAPTFAWAGGIGGVGNDQGQMVAVDADGNSYYTGLFGGTADFDPGPGTFNLTALASSNDIYILKLNPAGNMLWAKSLGGTANEIGMGIALDASGNVNVIGYFSSPTVDFDPGPGTYDINNVGGSDLFMLKLDASGNFVSAFSWGSTGAEQGRAIHSDDAGNMYMTGSFSGSIDFDPGPGDATLTAPGSGSNIFVLKLDNSGNFLWATNFGSTSNDFGWVLDVDASGNVLVAGTFNGTVDFDPGPGTFNVVSAGTDIFILKLDASGNFVWAGRIGNTANENPNSLKTDAAGNVYLGGSFGGSAAFDFDPGPGTHNVTAVANSEDGFLLKVDAAGNFVSVNTFGSNGVDRIYGIAVDAAGNVYAMGFFANTVDFDPGAGTANLVSAGLFDIFFLKLDASGNYLWSVREGGTGNEFMSQATIDASGNIYAIGTFSGTASFGGSNYTSVGGNDFYVLKFGDPSTLPLHLISFNAYRENGSVQLKWTATNEENVSHFDVERSQDGKKFVSLAQVAARNHGSTEYYYTDAASFNSTVYYRLKISDADGAHSYSPVRAIKAAGYSVSVQISPVPAKNILTITTTGLPAANGRISIQVFNGAGQLVKSGSMQAGNVHTMDVSTLGKGNYFIRLSGAGDYQSTHQFLKQ